MARLGFGMALVVCVASVGCAAENEEATGSSEAASSGADGPVLCKITASLGVNVREQPSQLAARIGGLPLGASLWARPPINGWSRTSFPIDGYVKLTDPATGTPLMHCDGDDYVEPIAPRAITRSFDRVNAVQVVVAYEKQARAHATLEGRWSYTYDGTPHSGECFLPPDQATRELPVDDTWGQSVCSAYFPAGVKGTISFTFKGTGLTKLAFK